MHALALKWLCKLALLMCLTSLLATGVQAEAGSYSFTYLGNVTTAGHVSYASAINNAGQVVGGGELSPGTGYHAAVWNGTTVTNLSGSQLGAASGNNNLGQVVGSTETLSGPSMATVWNGTTPTFLALNGTARAINDHGQIAGIVGRNAVIWNGTAATVLSGLGGLNATAVSINSAGQVVGSSCFSGDLICHATQWNGGAAIDLGTLNGTTWSDATAINDAGLVVGASYLSGTANNISHAVLWSGSTIVDLDPLSHSESSRAVDINNAGQIIGYRSTGDGTVVHATLWDGGVATDLTAAFALEHAGWSLLSADGINDSGVITGSVRNTATGATGLYLLTPSAVPEPAGVLLMVAGTGFVTFAVRRRRAVTI